jgi:hypothetical protein
MQDTIDGQLGAILAFRPIILYEEEVSQKRHESRLYLEVPRHEATRQRLCLLLNELTWYDCFTVISNM